jgi:hypothetical protein
MIIPGVSDEDHLEQLHWNRGGGRGAAGYRHVPSGLRVTRECLRTSPFGTFMKRQWRKLARELRARGLLDLRYQWRQP